MASWWTEAFLNTFGNTYTSLYWCLFPATPQEEAVPRLQDCQDNLQDRLGKLHTSEHELRSELFQLRNRKDRSRLRRVWLERQSIVRDIKVTENTLWTIERQIALFERSDLDALIINSLKASNLALQDIAERGGYSVGHVEEVTDALVQRMQEAHDITENVSGVLQTGLDQDMDGLEQELEQFLSGNDDMLDFVIAAPPAKSNSAAASASGLAAAADTRANAKTLAAGADASASGLQEVEEAEADRWISG
eukprot:1096571-Rhodomonas_salina.1